MTEIWNGYLTLPPVALHVELILVSKLRNNSWWAWPVFFSPFLIFQVTLWTFESQFIVLLPTEVNYLRKACFPALHEKLHVRKLCDMSCCWKERMFTIICKCFFLFPFHCMLCTSLALHESKCTPPCILNSNSRHPRSWTHTCDNLELCTVGQQGCGSGPHVARCGVLKFDDWKQTLRVTWNI